MLRAVGFSENRFDPKDPGRLCRGRERWIEPWEWEADEHVPLLHRIVVSGATFSDDGAADARRGLPFSGLDVASVVGALYADDGWIAFMEDGHPADIPPGAQGLEAYEGYRAGGHQALGLVRWFLPLASLDELRALLATGPSEEMIRGIVVVDRGADLDVDSLMDRVYHLVGLSTLDSPPARYQPAALPEVLAIARAVILLHRDKHGPALAVYANDPIEGLEGRLTALCAASGPQPVAKGKGKGKGASASANGNANGDGNGNGNGNGTPLVVPFAIPPMLARWDRALAELRDGWASNHDGPFPVPAAAPQAGGRRGRGRWPADEEEVEPIDEALPVEEPGDDEE